MVKNKQTPGGPFKLPDEPIVPITGTHPQQTNLQQVMMQAGQLQAQGRLQESEALLRQILQAQPDFAPAIHLLGVIAHQSGQNDMAIELIQKAIAINDNVALFHANLGEMLRTRGDIEGAIRHGERAVALEPGMAAALSNLGIAYYDQEDYERARQCHEKALALNASLPHSLNNMGSIMRAEEQPEKAMAFYHRAIAANANYLEPLNNLGLVLIEEDRHAEAIAPLTSAVQQNPGYSDAWCNLGCAYTVLEQFDKAMTAYQKAIELRPEYVEAHLGLSRIYMENENPADAEQMVKRALELDPDKADAHSMLGGIYNEMAYLDKADECYNNAINLDPESISAYLGKGHMHMEGGDFDIAEKCFTRALELEPDTLAIRFAFTQLGKVREDSEHFKVLRELKDVAALRGTEAINYFYAMGKCHDDTGNHKQAFEYYLQGAKLKRETVGYDPDANTSLTGSIASVFTREWIAGLSNGGNPSNVPIFILGMPRSGTTLTEQIIASHPDVYGAGELRDLKDIAARLISPAGKDYPRNLGGLNLQGLKLLGDEYSRRITERAPDSPHVTDKMPGNFQLVGLIHLILPNARIIHVMRNPLDTCISGFTRLFRNNQNQSYDLYEQGRFYQDYHRLMQHWRDVLPEGAFYEVQYEDLVQDNENQVRRLIDFCDLKWDDACLQSHKTKRTVRTASITQVRQPIYTSSLERWRRYEQFLGPLKEGLGGAISQTG
jgi:tetratricopeptide (TPR) repeat protein